MCMKIQRPKVKTIPIHLIVFPLPGRSQSLDRRLVQMALMPFMEVEKFGS